MKDKLTGDLFDTPNKEINVTIPKTLRLTEGNPGWYFNFDKDAIGSGGILGLPFMSSDGEIMLCLPIVYRKYYEENCAKHGVTLVWEQIASE